MNVLANLSSTYRDSLVAGGVAGLSHVRIDTKKGCGPGVSPYVEMMSVLQSLRDENPRLYQRVKREAVASLQAATRTASAALDIRQLVPPRRTARLYWVAGGLNRLAYRLFPGFGEPLTPRVRW